jgi:hypothetical protein
MNKKLNPLPHILKFKHYFKGLNKNSSSREIIPLKIVFENFSFTSITIPLPDSVKGFAL